MAEFVASLYAKVGLELTDCLQKRSITGHPRATAALLLLWLLLSVLSGWLPSLWELWQSDSQTEARGGEGEDLSSLLLSVGTTCRPTGALCNEGTYGAPPGCEKCPNLAWASRSEATIPFSSSTSCVGLQRDFLCRTFDSDNDVHGNAAMFRGRLLGESLLWRVGDLRTNGGKRH